MFGGFYELIEELTPNQIMYVKKLERHPKRSWHKSVKRLLHIFVFSSLHIALAALCLGYIVIKILALPLAAQPLLMIFLGIFTCYTINRMLYTKEDIANYPERVKFAQQYQKFFLSLAVISCCVVVALGLLKNINTLLVALISLLMYFLYHKKLKQVYLVKNLMIAIIWAFFCVFTIVSYLDVQITIPVLCTFLFVVLRDFINSIFFDVRDIKGDLAEGIHTIPVVLGVKKTLIVLASLNVLSFLYILICCFSGIFSAVSIALVVLVAYDFVYLLLCYKTNIDKLILYDLIADSEYIFGAVIISLVEWLGTHF